MKTTKLIFGFVAFVILFGLASAEVSERNNGFYGIINDDGSLTETQTRINDFNAIGFVCENDDCSNIAGTLWNGEVQNSGNNHEMTLKYPTKLQGAGYGIFFYKDGYFPYEVKSNFYGTGQANNAVRYLTRKANCQIPINHLIVSHNGTNVTVSVTLDAGVSSPVQSAGPLNYIPSSIANLYAVDAVVDFRFIGAQNISISKNVNLPASESREVFASTNLAAGQYIIEVESNANDASGNMV